MLDLRPRADRLGAPVEVGGGTAVAIEDSLVLDDIEHRERGAAGERVAAVGVRMQEAALESGRRRRHRRRASLAITTDSGRVPPGDPLGQAQEVGRDARLLAGEKRPGPPESDCDLVGDQEHFEAVADFAGAAQVLGVVHRHASCALHQRLDDQRGGLRGVPLRDDARAPRRSARHTPPASRRSARGASRAKARARSRWSSGA